MIRKEFSTLTQHKGLMLTMVAIILIPFFYSFCFLTSAWDPYGNTGKIPVAVVNLDQPAELQGTKITAGADTVHNLRNDDQLEWHFVSAAKAKAGMKNNDYYTVVTIPKNFSAHAATALNAHPKQMQLTYQTNGSLNYVSEIISQVGADKLNSQIKEKVTTAFLTQLFAKINGMGTQLKTAADGSAQLKDGVGQYTDGVTQVDDGLSQLNTGLGTLYSQVPTLASGVNQLNNGGGQLQTGLGQLNSKVPALTKGVNQLTTGAQQINNEVNGNKPDTDLVASVSALSTGMSKLSKGITQLKTAGAGLPGGVSRLAAAMTKLQATVTKQIGLFKTFYNDQKYPAVSNMLGLGSGFDTEKKQLQTNQSTADANMQKAIDAVTDPTQKAALQTAFDADKKASSATASGLGKAYMVLNTVKYNLTTTDREKEKNPATDEKDPLGLLTAVSEMTTGVTQIDNGLNKPNSENMTYSSAIAALESGAQKIDSGLATLNQKAPKLSAGISALTNGLGQLQGSTPALATGVNQLYTGSTQLAGGLNQLQGNVPALSSGVSQLYTGSGQLKDGTTKLTANNAKLNDGTEQLATGLAAGYQELSATKLTKLTAKMFAAPSKDVQLKYTTVKNYGAALAPYVLALALFIAIIIFNFAYPMKRKDADDQPLLQWLGGKVLMGTLVAVAAGFTEATLIILISHLPVAHVGAFYAITILFALSAMYLTQMLNIAFNRVGIFIALGLLTLSGSGGLFPAETISPLYESTQKFLPMTYAINGYRDAISGGIAGDTVAISVMLLVVVALLSLALMLPAAKLRDPQSTTFPTD
ncbi:YhgE/Pip family protein [Lacticaseibacillus nasuensis]|uniref:YhgE/Pip family protein n=1 Tax=Lacticaseibacillus nasuensis TaxID=944671 RepID=UPI002245EC90|nr:YhgE/Pip domain-containing protein [Lacticaseibacillus nasuensis]MCX2455205.1 YhgE/Pip domain-containing protein [Lacticaseibacillus nasuensis]